MGLVRVRRVNGEVGGAVVDTGTWGGDKLLLRVFLLPLPLLLFLEVLFFLEPPPPCPGLVSMSELTLAKSASGSASPPCAPS